MTKSSCLAGFRFHIRYYQFCSRHFSLHATILRFFCKMCHVANAYGKRVYKRVQGMFTPDLEHKPYSYMLFSNIVDAAACSKIVWWYWVVYSIPFTGLSIELYDFMQWYTDGNDKGQGILSEHGMETDFSLNYRLFDFEWKCWQVITRYILISL